MEIRKSQNDSLQPSLLLIQYRFLAQSEDLVLVETSKWQLIATQIVECGYRSLDTNSLVSLAFFRALVLWMVHYFTFQSFLLRAYNLADESTA